MKKIIIFGMAAMLFLTGCGTAKNTVYSLEDLEGKTIGVQLKTTGDVYASDIKDATVQRFNRGKDAVLALKNGVVDAVMLDDAPAKVFVEEIGGVRLLREPYAEEEYGIAVSKENPELLEKINDALGQLKEEGVLDEITDAWLQNGVEVSAYEGQNRETYENGILVMSTNAEFPPYESITDGGEIVGIDVDIMKAVCDKLGMKLQIENTAFDSIIAAVERGMADVGVAAMTITDERLEQVNFSSPYMKATQVIIVRDDSRAVIAK